MDNLMEDKPRKDDGCKLEPENKRKRRCSSTEPNESPRKKTALISVVVEDKESASSVTSDDPVDTKGVTEEGKPDIEQVNKNIESHFLLEELCDEVLYEIFKFLDTWSLMALMNVCNRFQKFVLDKRLWKNIDLCKEPLPLGILEDMLERSHDKTKCIKLRGPSPSQHIDGEIQHFNQTMQNSFTTRCTKLVSLELYGVTLDFNQITLKDFPKTLKRLVLNTCNVRIASNKSMFTGIDTILVNLEELAVENNSWFDPYYIMPLSKLPLLRYLSLKGCWQMQEFIPYGSIAARHGFKQLEILDLRDTPIYDSDLQCFNAVESLKEIYLQCPEEKIREQVSSTTNLENEITNSQNSNLLSGEKATTSNETADTASVSSTSTSKITGESENKYGKRDVASNETADTASVSSTFTSKISVVNEIKYEKTDEALATPSSSPINDGDSSSPSSSSSSSSSPVLGSPTESNNASTSTGLSPNIVPLLGTNAPPRSRFLPRPDHIFYLDVRNRTSPNAVHFNIRDHNYVRNLRLPGQGQQQNPQQSPPPVIEQMMRHNLFWDIVNPLGRVVGVGGPDRLFGEENGAEYHLNLFSLSSSNRPQSRGSITDRGVCCFGRTRQPVQQGVIWIRFNNRPSENRFERFSVRDYRFVTDISLQHLVQCSPHLIFLDVSGTSVTLAGLQRFKELKPECKIVAEHLLDVTQSEKTVS